MVRSIFFLLAIFLSTNSFSGENPVECLAKNIYFEARNQGFEGKLAVFFVTFHRVQSAYFPDTYCEVVWDKGQFEWTNDGKSDTPKELVKYHEILDLSIEFMINYSKYEDPTNGALFYHADYVRPCWLPDATLLAVIRKHKFYDVDHIGTSCWDLLQKRKRDADT